MQPATLNKQSAFSLIEVLIALLILAVGMLAFAASEIMGQRGTHSALKRSDATTLANDLAERIHANPTGNYLAALTSADCPLNPDKTCAAAQDNQAVPKCTADEMAAFDLSQWFCGNGSYRGGAVTLLGGPGRDQTVNANIVCNDIDAADEIDCTPGSSYKISLTWQERDPDRDDSATNQANVDQAHGAMTSKTLDIAIVP